MSDTFCKFVIGRAGKSTQTDIPRTIIDHIASLTTMHRYEASLHRKIQDVASAAHAQPHLAVTWPAQTLHDVVGSHFYPCNDRIVHRYDTVTCQQSGFLGRATRDHLHHIDRIREHIELDTNPVKSRIERLQFALGLLGIGVKRMRIQLIQDTPNGIFGQLVIIDAVHVKRADGIGSHLHLTERLLQLSAQLLR